VADAPDPRDHRHKIMPRVTAARRCIVCDSAGPFAFVFSVGGYRLVRCPGCHLVFQDPQPSDRVLADSYYHDREFSEALFGELRAGTLELARHKLGLLEGAGGVRPGGRALDVGCASGAWLEVARSAGLTATGVEIGEATAEGARGHGLDVRTGTLEEALPELEAERFDLITFWDVLEHLRDPRHELALAARLLAPGGLVAATFPNVEGWYPRLTYRLLARRTGVWEYPELPLHLYDFSPTTARCMFERTGYRVVGLRTHPTPFEFYRETSLSPQRLGRGRRGRVLRLAFEALRVGVYPVARLWDRANSLFLVATRNSGG
jgi:SAM-dependent methyltransferase